MTSIGGGVSAVRNVAERYAGARLLLDAVADTARKGFDGAPEDVARVSDAAADLFRRADGSVIDEPAVTALGRLAGAARQSMGDVTTPDRIAHSHDAAVSLLRDEARVRLFQGVEQLRTRGLDEVAELHANPTTSGLNALHRTSHELRGLIADHAEAQQRSGLTSIRFERGVHLSSAARDGLGERASVARVDFDRAAARVRIAEGALAGERVIATLVDEARPAISRVEGVSAVAATKALSDDAAALLAASKSSPALHYDVLRTAHIGRVHKPRLAAMPQVTIIKPRLGTTRGWERRLQDTLENHALHWQRQVARELRGGPPVEHATSSFDANRLIRDVLAAVEDGTLA